MDADAAREVALVRNWYERTATTFDARYSGPAAEFWQLFEEEAALQWLGPASRILDLGCGAGRLSQSLSALGDRVLGIDISLAMLAIAQAKAHPPNVRYAVMDATSTAADRERFGAVISLGMFEYLDDPSPFLDEILRLLEPGGRLLFTCHNRVPFLMRALVYGEAKLLQILQPGRQPLPRHGAPHVSRHQPSKMLALLHSRGFVEADYRGFHFAPAVDLFRIGSRFGSPRLRTAAARLDHAAGRSVLTRSLCSLSMYSARKAR